MKTNRFVYIILESVLESLENESLGIPPFSMVIHSGKYPNPVSRLIEKESLILINYFWGFLAFKALSSISTSNPFMPESDSSTSGSNILKSSKPNS